MHTKNSFKTRPSLGVRGLPCPLLWRAQGARLLPEFKKLRANQGAQLTGAGEAGPRQHCSSDCAKMQPLLSLRLTQRGEARDREAPSPAPGTRHVDIDPRPAGPPAASCLSLRLLLHLPRLLSRSSTCCPGPYHLPGASQGPTCHHEAHREATSTGAGRSPLPLIPKHTLRLGSALWCARTAFMELSFL